MHAPDDHIQGRRPKTMTDEEYVAKYADSIYMSIRAAIGPSHQQPHMRLRWRGGDMTSAFMAIRSSIDWQTVPGPRIYNALAELILPANLHDLVDDARRGPAGTMSTFEVVSNRISAAMESAMYASVERMGARAVAQWDATPAGPTEESLIPSCPLDAAIAHVLVSKEDVEYKPAKTGTHAPKGPFAEGVRKITGFHWVEGDPNLWNWIRVTNPAHATVEDVAGADFIRTHFPNASSIDAYRIVASPPYFGLPFEVAKEFPEATKNATIDVRLEMANYHRDPHEGPEIADAGALAASRNATIAADAALAQAQKPVGQLKPNEALRRAYHQATFLRDKLKPWNAGDAMLPTLQFLQDRAMEIGKHEAAIWAGVLEAQERTLHAVASEIVAPLEIATAGHEAAVKAAEKDKRKPDRDEPKWNEEPNEPARKPDFTALEPTLKVVRAYADAAGASHLGVEGPALLQRARELKATLALANSDVAIRSTRNAMVDQEATNAHARQRDDYKGDEHWQDTGDTYRDLELRSQDLHAKFGRGERVDPYEVDLLAVDANEDELRSRLVTLSTSVADLQREAKAEGVDTDDVGGMPSIDSKCNWVLGKINGPKKSDAELAKQDWNDHHHGGWHEQLSAARTYNGPPDHTKEDSKVTILAQRRKAISEVGAQLSAFAQEFDFKGLFEDAQRQIKGERIKKIVRDIAIQVGVAVVTGEVVGAIGATVRGIAVAGEIGEELRGASLAYESASMLAQASVNTITQGALGGELSFRSLAENILAMGLTSVAMKPFAGLLEDSAAVEGEIETWEQELLGGSDRMGLTEDSVAVAVEEESQTLGQKLLARSDRMGLTKGVKIAAELVIENGVAIGASSIAHAVTHAGEVGAQDAQSILTMGASIVASRFVHSRTKSMHERLQEAMAHSERARRSELDALVKRTDELAKRTTPRDPKKDPPPTPEETMAALKERHRILLEEEKIYSDQGHSLDDIGRLNEAKREAGIGTGQLQLEVPLQLAHLTSVVEGQVYEGRPEQIENAFRAADEAGFVMKREWSPENSTWKLTSGDRTIEVYESGDRPIAKAAAAQVHHGSEFTGEAPKGRPRPTFGQQEVVSRGYEAMKMLDPKGQHITAVPDGVFITGPDGKYVYVHFKIAGKAMPDPATHNFKPGSNDVTIEFSPEARTSDLTRAAAHEIAEIQRGLNDPASWGKKGAFEQGAKTNTVRPHDVGRIAEVDVLVADHVKNPSVKDPVAELEALLKDVGLDPDTIGTDPRARKLLGDARITGIVEALTTRDLPVRSANEDRNVDPEAALATGTAVDAIQRPRDIPEAEFQRMARDRGGTGRELARRAPGWTGRREAEFRYGREIAGMLDQFDEGYHWSTSATGDPIVVRDREVFVSGEVVARRRLDPGAIATGDPERIFPAVGDDVVPAKRRTGPRAISAADYQPGAVARRKMDQLAHQRRAQIAERNRLEGEVQRLMDEMSLSEDDLTSERWHETIDRLRREVGSDAAARARVDQLEQSRRGLATARDQTNAASEQIGGRMAMDYMAQQQGRAQRVYGDPTRRGRPGEFDFIYVVTNSQGRVVEVFLVEAKGGSSTLGTRLVEGVQQKQGTPAYARSIAEAMLADASLSSTLREALKAVDNPDAHVPVRYLLVEARLDGGGAPRPGRVSQFELKR